MATIALPQVGTDRTFSLDWSFRASHRLSMMIERFALWHRVEPRVDLWASVGALGLAVLATTLVFVV